MQFKYYKQQFYKNAKIITYFYCKILTDKVTGVKCSSAEKQKY